MAGGGNNKGGPGGTPVSQRALDYWRANKRLIASLLVVWAGVSFGAAIFGGPFLNRFSLGTLPLGFWIAQQGSIFVFVVLVFAYAIGMDRLDRKHGMNQRQGEE